MNRNIAVALGLVALLGGYSLASAQEKVDGNKTQELKQADPTASTGVLVNGRLTAPGAPTDGQAVPSKYSARNAALDQLSIVAFRFHHLTEAQRREIFERLHGDRGGLALSPGHAMVGAVLPTEIALRDLKPVPESLTTKFPELRGTSYLAEEPNVLIVDSLNNAVIAVLSAQ